MQTFVLRSLSQTWEYAGFETVLWMLRIWCANWMEPKFCCFRESPDLYVWILPWSSGLEDTEEDKQLMEWTPQIHKRLVADISVAMQSAHLLVLKTDVWKLQLEPLSKKEKEKIQWSYVFRCANMLTVV